MDSAEIILLSPDKDDNLLSMSGISATSGNLQVTSVRQDFPKVLTMAVERVGFTLPHRSCQNLFQLHEDFYWPAHLAQPSFVFPPLSTSSVFQSVLGREPLKTKAPVAALVDFLRVQGCMENICPGMLPMEEAFAALLITYLAGWSVSSKLLLPLRRFRDTLEYFEKKSGHASHHL